MANSSTKDALHSVTKHNDISISGVSSNEVLRFDGTNWVNSLPSSSLVVTQSSHGFSVGDVLKSSGSNGAYAKAQANNAGNAEVLGIVTAVADTNTFTLTVSGYITTAAAVPDVTAGSALFLSASTAGALTATEPSTAGQISKPVAIVTTANAAMIIVAYRGETISTGANNWDVNGSELVLDADGDTSLTADTDDQIDVKISGADDFRFTANNLNVLSGSTLTIDSGATIANSGTATGFSVASAITREGGNTSEATTTSTSEDDLMAAASLTIAATQPFMAIAVVRKTSGAASRAELHLALNSTNANGTNVFSTTNQAEAQTVKWEYGARVTNYTGHGYQFATDTAPNAVGKYAINSVALPTAQVTSVKLRGRSINSAVTYGQDELHVYSLAVS